MTNLVHINHIGPGDGEGADGFATLRNTSYEPKHVPTKFPAKIWVVFADEDGHVGPPTELTIK